MERMDEMGQQVDALEFRIDALVEQANNHNHEEKQSSSPTKSSTVAQTIGKSPRKFISKSGPCEV